MQIISEHRFAGQVKTTFDLEAVVVPARNPIGVAVSEETVAEKPDELKQSLQGIDLRNISRDQLAAVGLMLFHRGRNLRFDSGQFHCV